VKEKLDLPNFEILSQSREMRREQIDDYLDRLRAQDRPTLILAVQGGVFAEGVDYPGEMLIGALIIGPALPTFDFERELLREYFESKYGNGFDYAYTYPAMAKVIQSAGRVIRSSQDRGLIVLMDRRFMHENYLRSMPADWLPTDVKELVSTQILSDIEGFWKSHDA
jgi:DNA excision repair protein ERCC-2